MGSSFPVKIQTDQSGIIEQLTQENELLKSICSEAVAERLQLLNKRTIELQSERDNLAGQVAQTEKRIKEVQQQAVQLVAEAKKRHDDGSSRQKGVWESRVYELNSEINKLKGSLKVKDEEINKLNQLIREQELKIKEQSSLLVGRCEEIERLQALDEKVTSVLEIVTSSFDLLKNKVNSCSNTEEVKRAVEQVEKDVVTQLKTGDIKEEYIKIMQLKAEGLTQKQIAEMLYPSESGREQKVIKRIKRGNKEGWFELINS